MSNHKIQRMGGVASWQPERSTMTAGHRYSLPIFSLIEMLFTYFASRKAALSYAIAPTETVQATAWRVQLARCWVQCHIALSLALLVVSLTLVLSSIDLSLGLYMLVSAFATLALNAIALNCVRYAVPGGAVLLVLAADMLTTFFGILVLGTQAQVLFLLPGALVMAALLANQLIIFCASAGFLLYAGALLAGSLARRPHLLTTAIALQWGNLLVMATGMVLLLIALWLLLARLQIAQSSEAALAYKLQVLERHMRTKRIALDADAIALQTELVHALRGDPVHPVTTCEDLAPLANMINATTARLPGLLRDREERLHLEHAIRDLALALEAARAGLNWSYPPLSGTAVDRLVAALQRPPSHLPAR